MATPPSSSRRSILGRLPRLILLSLPAALFLAILKLLIEEARTHRRQQEEEPQSTTTTMPSSSALRQFDSWWKRGFNPAAIWRRLSTTLGIISADGAPNVSSDDSTTAAIYETAKEYRDIFQGGPEPLFDEKRFSSFPIELVEKVALTHNSYLFVFKLKEAGRTLGLFPGMHCRLALPDADGKEIIRPYHAISSSLEPDFVKFVIKVYEKGVFTQLLDKIKLNDDVKILGPFGAIKYVGQGEFIINSRLFRFKKVLLLGGGTGITPLFSIINYAKNIFDDPMQISLITANLTPDDILMKKEFDDLKDAGKIKLLYTVNRLAQDNKEWPHSIGYINQEMISSVFEDFESEDSAVFICGPPPMTQSLKDMLKNMNFKNIFQF